MKTPLSPPHTPVAESGGEEPLRVRRWSELRGVVSIELTRKATDEDMVLLNRAIRVFVGALEHPDQYAAAPELLEALKELCDQIGEAETHGDGAFDPGCPVCIAHQDARAAISKATASLGDKL